jgi:branched-chain amino acid transport system ATP-binding protein
MLSVKNLAISYGQHQAVRDITIKTGIGEVVVILGANGAGKSSLLRAIAGLSKGQVAGDISFKGESLLGMSPDEIVTAGIALVPEGRAIFGALSVEENLRLGAFNTRARDKQVANLDQVLTLFPKLRERRRQIARTMSGGEQQMVAVGRALMSDPSILMLDEPSLGLSPLLSRELFQALGKIRETGIGVLVVEQNAKLSLSIADRGYLIENGQLVGENDAASLASDPAVQAAYLGGGGKAASPRPLAAKLKPIAPAAPPKSPAGEAPATGAPQAARAPAEPQQAAPASGGNEKVFIKPAGLAGGVQRADQLLGGADMGQLLSRASQAATPRRDVSMPVRQTVKVAPAPRIVTITPSADEPGRAGQRAALDSPSVKSSVAPAASTDAEIAALLNDFEAAAEKARQGTQQPPASRSQQQGPAPRLDRGPLPDIPVFKKARVEVFKRDNNGVLTKAREA